MTNSYLLDPLVFLVQTLFGLYTAVVALRFLLQWVRADFYNPISQFVVKITSPVLRPLRRFIPGYGGLDLAALLLVWLLIAVEYGLIAMIAGLDRSPLGAFGWAIPGVVELFINIFLFSVLIRVILSWVNPDPYNPAVALLDRITDPVMRPAQRLIRPIGGIDLSPMLVMIGLVLLNMLLIPPLQWLVRSPF
ncbi:YggT family protein [Imhoffiella purpurea]|uniref:Integral membrane protein YggT, involved in response to extracytoplasmic stress (Osmotic shock) n=1 Tax=Imhoffiella purpurea TaxID=1249627 RepID=W9W0A1_9GAMM|nr:YggT family protein [Imhoffiella purpurea]EXJ16060.1 Integral membrane protein YggT, involved in response to extracytoplasmic stress (osmotic shock) [Imhoffiella purpurea]